MDVRLLIPEILKARSLTAYQLAKLSGGRIPMSTAYRLADPKVTETSVDFTTLAAVIDVLKIERFDQLFSRDDEPGHAPAPPAKAAKATKRARPTKAPARKRAKG